MTADAQMNLRELADRLADDRITLDKANDIAKEAQRLYDESEAKLFEALENAGIRQFRTERGLFTQNDLAWASVTDEATARAWADEYWPELLTLNRQRLSVIVRQSLRGDRVAGLEPGAQPPGVDFRTSRKITWRRT